MMAHKSSSCQVTRENWMVLIHDAVEKKKGKRKSTWFLFYISKLEFTLNITFLEIFWHDQNLLQLHHQSCTGSSDSSHYMSNEIIRGWSRDTDSLVSASMDNN